MVWYGKKTEGEGYGRTFICSIADLVCPLLSTIFVSLDGLLDFRKRKVGFLSRTSLLHID